MAKKTTKKRAEAKSSAPTLASLKKQVQENYKNCKVQRLLYRFERGHFEAELSQTNGFGANDLKQPYFDLYNYLLTKHKKNLVVKPTNINYSSMQVELWVNE